MVIIHIVIRAYAAHLDAVFEMKKLPDAINGLQLTCMRRDFTFADLAKARKDLIAAIRESISEGMAGCPGAPAKVAQDYLAKFDKLMSPP